MTRNDFTLHYSNTALKEHGKDDLAIDQTIAGELDLEPYSGHAHVQTKNSLSTVSIDNVKSLPSPANDSDFAGDQAAAIERVRRIQVARSRRLFTRAAVALLVGSSTPLIAIAYIARSSAPIAEEQKIVADSTIVQESVELKAVNLEAMKQEEKLIENVLFESPKPELENVPEAKLAVPEQPVLQAGTISETIPETQNIVSTSEPTSEGVTQVAIGDPNAALALAKEQPLPKVQPENQTTIVEYAESRAVTVGPRRYLMVTSTPRSYSPAFATAKNQNAYGKSTNQNGNGTRARVNLHSLRGMGNNRYQADNNAVEWQGGWTYADPSHNLKIGSAYSQYLSEQVGAAGSAELSAVLPQRSSLLSRTSKTGVGPTAASHK